MDISIYTVGKTNLNYQQKFLYPFKTYNQRFDIRSILNVPEHIYFDFPVARTERSGDDIDSLTNISDQMNAVDTRYIECDNGVAEEFILKECLIVSF